MGSFEKHALVVAPFVKYGLTILYCKIVSRRKAILTIFFFLSVSLNVWDWEELGDIIVKTPCFNKRCSCSASLFIDVINP